MTELFDLTRDQLDEFVRTGLLVVPDVLDETAVQTARQALHAQLSEHGLDHDALLAGAQSAQVGVRLKSPGESERARERATTESRVSDGFRDFHEQPRSFSRADGICSMSTCTRR
jgi:hypothetical protein